jgi:flagellar hook-associated protein 1 FlgK
MRGLLNTSSRVQLVSQNITNADKPGYTRKEGTSTFVTTNGGSVPVRLNVSGTGDRFLTQSMVTDVSSVGRNRTINEFLDLYAKKLGTTDGSTTMSGYLNDMYGALQQLSTTPETMANKTEVMQIASNLSDSMRNLSLNIQTQRLEAEKKIGETVNNINNIVTQIDELNKQIASAQGNDAQVAELEDERNYQIQKLSEDIGIQYYYNSQNQVQIYTDGGQALLISSPRPISYTQTSVVNGATTYPTGFNPILLDGVDQTTLLQTGKLSGLIHIRDTALVNEQEKLDQFANVMSFEMNRAMNRGSSLPPPPTLTGSEVGFAGATAFSGTGTFRVAVINPQGIVQSAATINLVGMTTVNDLVTALNGVANIAASLNSSGQLVISSTLANTGVSLNEMNSNIGALNQGVSHFFGMNNLFEGAGASTGTSNGAETVTVKDFYRNNPDYIPVGALDVTAGVGGYGVTRGDGTISMAMSQIIKTNVSFNAAGNFGAQSNTMHNYIQAIMADGSNQARLAEQEADTSQLTFEQTKAVFDGKAGVNIDEETTKLIALENNYQANARMIATIRDMFRELLDAIR